MTWSKATEPVKNGWHWVRHSEDHGLTPTIKHLVNGQQIVSIWGIWYSIENLEICPIPRPSEPEKIEDR